MSSQWEGFQSQPIPVPKTPGVEEILEADEKADVQPEEQQTGTRESEKQSADVGVTPSDDEAVLCPRCLWRVDQPFPAEISEEDKERFILAAAKGERFTKRFEILPGKLYAVFRTLLTSEKNHLQLQIRQDILEGRMVGLGDFWDANLAYRTALQCQQVEDENGQVLAVIPPLEEFLAKASDKDKPQIVRKVREWFEREICPTEPLLRLFTNRFREFSQIEEAIIFRTPDFFGKETTSASSSSSS